MTVRPVQRQVTVEVTQERAFALFTGAMGSWWNPGHHVGERPFADVVVEPREGGRWFEVDEGGVESPWGSVLVWDPPHRLLLAWQLDAGWAHDPHHTTEVEVRFVADGPARTRVELEHRGLERYGADADEVAAQLGADGGWAGLLRRFAEELQVPA